ncbi:MAG: hypothetical protein IKR05_08430 [Prevotella sp.]|nr:hypothetical protein [Prevotella sp.]
MTIITTIPALCLSAALPDEISIGTQYSIIGIKIKVDNEVVWTTDLYSFQNVARLYDIRTVVETAIRANNNASGVCCIVVNEDGTEASSTNFTVIMSDIKIPNVTSWLQSHFLTTVNAHRICRNGKQILHWFAAQGESMTYKIIAKYKGQAAQTGEEVEYEATWTQQSAGTVNAGIYNYTVDVGEIEQHFEQNIISFKVQRGANRTMEFFVIDDVPELQLSFLNNFNVAERADLFIDSNKKTKMEASEATSLRNQVKFDFNVETEFQVETAPLPIDLAKWLTQLFTSRYVTKFMPDNTWIEILIDGESEVTNKPNAENSIKFTYKYTKKVQYLD